MKIVDKSSGQNSCTFGVLNAGDLFSSRMHIYMKVECVRRSEGSLEKFSNAICFDTNTHSFFDRDSIVGALNGHVVITGERRIICHGTQS